MRIDIMTLFPDAIEAMMGQSIIGRARDRGFVELHTHQIRDYTTNKQMQVDDYPYGGGRGAVMQADPLYRCWEHICQELGRRPHTIYMSPCGRVFNQEVAKELKAAHESIILVCGHYEGVDQRFIDECVDEELSMGDFVLTGGEMPAAMMTDAIVRLLPGALGDVESALNDSFQDGLLEAGVYTRPAEYKGWKVPEILLSGHQAKIEEWNYEQSLAHTKERRPDLLEEN